MAVRGVVWEETIILLPDKVRYVFLSATIPNAMQFAEWIVKMHNQPCHVVYTDFRPTPLQHYFFPAGGEGIFLVVDEKGAFREENFQKAMGSIADKKGDDPSDAMAKRKGKGKDKRLNKGGNEGPSGIDHAFDGARNTSRGASDTGQIDSDDATPGGEGVDDARIPLVKSGSKVGEQHGWCPTVDSEVTVRDSLAVDPDASGGGGSPSGRPARTGPGRVPSRRRSAGTARRSPRCP